MLKPIEKKIFLRIEIDEEFKNSAQSFINPL